MYNFYSEFDPKIKSEVLIRFWSYMVKVVNLTIMLFFFVFSSLYTKIDIYYLYFDFMMVKFCNFAQFLFVSYL